MRTILKATLPGVLAILLGVLAMPPGPAKADPIAVGAEHCVVNIPATDQINLRREPDAASPVNARRSYGTCGIVVMGNCAGAWCPVSAGRDAGWAPRNRIAAVSPARACVTGVASWDTLNVRAFPSARSRVLLELGPRQCSIRFLPFATDGWQKIRVGASEGWVARRFLTAP